MRIYKDLKCKVQCEPYLKHVCNPNLRKSLPRLRISCHRFLIEIGRYSIPKIPTEDRLCKFYNLDQVEDEMHLISMCLLYQQNRDILYQVASKESKHFPYLKNRNKFTWLMCNETNDVCLQ